MNNPMRAEAERILAHEHDADQPRRDENGDCQCLVCATARQILAADAPALPGVTDALRAICDNAAIGNRDWAPDVIVKNDLIKAGRAALSREPAPASPDLVTAAEAMDWQQVVLNGGPPCFHIDDDGGFCGRAKGWEGHGMKETFHPFVSLADLLRTALRQSPRPGEQAAEANKL